MFVKQNNELKNTKMQMLGSKACETFILHKNRFIAKYAQENRMNIGHCKHCKLSTSALTFHTYVFFSRVWDHHLSSSAHG